MSGFQWVETRDLVVVGGGAAGLTAALSAAPMNALVLVRNDPYKNATSYAQGGVAVAIDAEDEALHLHDTLESGSFASDQEAVKVLVSEGPSAVAWLERHGLDWDRKTDGSLVLGREGAHSANRIRHAGGDATGFHISKTLQTAALAASTVELRYQAQAVKIFRDHRGVAGLAVLWGKRGLGLILTRRVVLATGGYAGLYRPTTSPSLSPGEGLVLAAEIGCDLHDLEMVQFHPTALATSDGRSLPLLTEALRGAGARLVLESGQDLVIPHPMGPLGPRDIVARAIFSARTAGRDVFLDARHLPLVNQHFPTVAGLLRPFGLNLETHPVPVTPAAHYTMGGIATDLDGAATVPGLWVAGEAASTGVHGANRLASNSLLECLVFGRRAGKDAAGFLNAARHHPEKWEAPVDAEAAVSKKTWDKLGALLFHAAGPVRVAQELEQGLAALESFEEKLPEKARTARRATLLARGIIESSLARRDSRGAHFRADHPNSAETPYSPTVWRPAFGEAKHRQRLSA